jgi:Papain-like cysteine protease AvrRpt2
MLPQLLTSEVDVNLAEFVSATSRPYSELRTELSILGRLFSSRQLSFTMEAQTQTNWCWAATATSVSHFYWFWSTWTQCKVANGELGRADCCNSSVPSLCNVPWYLDRALTRTNNYVSIMSGQASFQQVRAEIDAGRPVGARIGWSGGGGHFMAIYGYSTALGDEYLDIDDPIYGKSHLTFADFASNYQGSGSWTHTYFTKSYFKMPIKVFYPIDPVIRRIWEARPLLSMKQSMSFTGQVSAEDEKATLGMAHRVYSLGLDSLLAKKGSRAPKPEAVSLRVFEMSGDTPSAFFDVTEGEDPRVLQMSASKVQLEQLARGLGQAVAAAGGNEQEYELRLLRVPALNFEAFWLNYGTEAKDLLVPIRAAGTLTPGKTVSLAEALEALREVARTLAEMDDLMGA